MNFVLNSSDAELIYRICDGLVTLSLVVLLWALFAWPGKSVTRKYPLSIRLTALWPFGLAGLMRLQPRDAGLFEVYRGRARIVVYVGVLAAVLALAMVLCEAHPVISKFGTIN